MRAAVLALPLTLLGAGVAHAATFAVDSPGTAVDAAPGDGTCRTAGGACTLRAAVAESEALGGQNAITLPAGTYSLAAPIDAGQNRLRISGAGAATTIVDGNSRAPLIARRGTLVVAGLTVRNGDGGSAGGAIRVMTGAHLVAVGVVLDGNEAFTGGGGLYVAPGADARVVRSAITGNAATGAFGGGVWNQGTLDLEDSLVAGNRSNRAGGIRNEGELRLRNVTVDGNEATSPEAGVGGISQNGFAFLSNVTVTRNLGRGANPASFRGGGIQTTAGELTVLKNSVVAQNDGRGGPDDCDGPITSDSRYDLVQAPGAACILPASTATWLIGVDPQLGALAQNGGPTATRLPAPTSPLVDAGFPFTPGGPAADACEAADQRGVQRLRCDIGAVEREVPVPATITVDRTTDVADAVPGNGACLAVGGGCSLRAAVQEANRLPGLQTIVVPAGVYVLASAPAGEGGANPDAAGDLDLLEDVTIVGAGAATTRVDANALSRAFDAAPGVDIELTGLTLGNGRDAGGGALRLTSARAVLRGVALLRNVSTSGGGGAIQGGGLDERVEVLDSTLSENRAEGFGGSGGAIESGGTVIVRGSTLASNTATGSGGAISVTVGALELTTSRVRGNAATGTGALSNGGGVSASAAVVRDTTIDGNHAQAHGGGIYAGAGALENATVSGNTADDRGGGVSTSGTLALRHVTLTGNVGAAGGQDLLRFGSTSSLTLADVIVGSAGGTGCAGLAPTSAGGTIARDASCALAGPGDRQAVDPRLGPLADNGGPTPTHRLLAGSPALDAGRLATPPTDQRGAARPLGAGPDSGAVEGTASFAASAPQALVIGDDATADGADGRLVETLRGLGLRPRAVADDATAGVALAGVRLVVLSPTTDPARVARRVIRARAGVATWDRAVLARLGVLRAGTRARTASARAIRMTPAGRTALGRAGRVALTGAPVALLRIVPAAGGRVLARVDRPGRPATLVAFAHGARLAGGTRAAGRRLVLPLPPADATTSGGRRLLEDALRLAARP